MYLSDGYIAKEKYYQWNNPVSSLSCVLHAVLIAWLIRTFWRYGYAMNSTHIPCTGWIKFTAPQKCSRQLVRNFKHVFGLGWGRILRTQGWVIQQTNEDINAQTNEQIRERGGQGTNKQPSEKRRRYIPSNWNTRSTYPIFDYLW